MKKNILLLISFILTIIYIVGVTYSLSTNDIKVIQKDMYTSVSVESQTRVWKASIENRSSTDTQLTNITIENRGTNEDISDIDEVRFRIDGVEYPVRVANNKIIFNDGYILDAGERIAVDLYVSVKENAVDGSTYAFSLDENNFTNTNNIPSNIIIKNPLGVETQSVVVKYPDYENNYDIILIMGQSNAVGGGFGNRKTDENIEDILRTGLVNQLSIQPSKTLQVQEVQDFSKRLDHDNSSQGPSTNGLGFGVELAGQYAKNQLESGRKVLVLPVAHKGTSIMVWDDKNKGDIGSSNFRGDTDTTFLYEKMSRFVRYGLQLGGNNKVVGIFWQQGERDIVSIRDNGTTTNDFMSTVSDYKKHLSRVIYITRKVIQESSTNPIESCNIPFIIGEPVENWLATEPAKIEWLAMIHTYSKNTKRDCNIHITSSEGLLSNQGEYLAGDETMPTEERSDSIHFSAEAQRKLGIRHFQSLSNISQ